MSDTITNSENVTTSAGRDDVITATASPRPWRVNGHTIEANDPEGLWLQNKKTGWGVVANLPSCPKSRMSKKNRETWDAIVEANAALIVAAVNERDRLREENERLQLALGEAEASAECNLAPEIGRLRDLVRRMITAVEEEVAMAREIGEIVRSFCGMEAMGSAHRRGPRRNRGGQP